MRITSLFFIISLFFACKEAKKPAPLNAIEKVVNLVENSTYPEALQKVFEAHGGVKNWKYKRTLSFEIPSENGISEKQVIDLHTRKDILVNGAVAMGFDGADIWLLDPEKTYKGDPAFYHNLMFYFYAMPFVFADNGIVYSETKSIAFDGISYPGVKITFNSGVGASSKDEYYVHYNPDTYQMAWLGYTVTYSSGEKSDNVSWIRYNDWIHVDDVVLAKSITWHNYDGSSIKEAKKTVRFEAITLSEEAKEKGYYARPESAAVILGKQK